MRARVGLVKTCVASRRLRAPALLLACALLLHALGALAPALVERIYSRKIFPPLAAALSEATAPPPFSVGELLLACAAVATVALVCARVAGAVRGSDSCSLRRRILRLSFDLIVGAAWIVSVSALAFMLVFGLNYERRPLAQTLGYDQRRASDEELEAMAAEVVDAVNRGYVEAHAQGATTPGDGEIVGALEDSYRRLAADAPELIPANSYGPPKPVIASGALTRLGVSGFYFPFTGEANYNRLMPVFERPFAMAHEMAHQRGFARESEANFVAFLVCTQSTNAFVRYSGYRNGLGLLAELWRAAPERARDLYKRLGPGYREDNLAAYRFWSRGAGRVGALGRSINDIYLKANGVRSGVGNYSESTALLVGYYLKRGARANGSVALSPSSPAPRGLP